MAAKSRPKKQDVEDIKTALEDNFNNFDFRFKQRAFKFTENQKKLIDIVNDERTQMVLIEGPAGTAKSLTAVYCGLLLLKEKKIDSIMYLRSVVESAQKSMGFLPGSSDDKMQFFTEIIEDKLSELVEPKDIPGFHIKKKIETMPLNYIRGCSWRKKFIIADEIQNYNSKEILSTMTRIGVGSKMILCGDNDQSDIKNSGFKTVFKLFDTEESRERGIFTFKFTENDIVRSEIVKYIVTQFKKLDVFA